MQYFGMELSRKISPNHYLTRPTTPLYNKPPLPINCLNLSLDTIPSLSLLSTRSLIQFTHRNPHIKKPRNQTKGAPEALGEGKKKHQQTHKIYIYKYIYIKLFRKIKGSQPWLERGLSFWDYTTHV